MDENKMNDGTESAAEPSSSAPAESAATSTQPATSAQTAETASSEAATAVISETASTGEATPISEAATAGTTPATSASEVATATNEAATAAEAAPTSTTTAASQQAAPSVSATPTQTIPQTPVQPQYAAPAPGQVYPQYVQGMPAQSTGKATGALICGILAILFCGVPIVGIILGIVAIVLAGSYIKSGGTSGSAKGGRICGIIGIVLSVIMIIATIVLIVIGMNVQKEYSYTYSYDSAQNSTLNQNISSSSSASSSLASGEEADIEGVAIAELDRLAAADPTLVSQIAQMIDESLLDDYDVKFSDYGIDTKDYVTIMLEGFSYTDTDIYLASASSTAEFTCDVKIRSIIDVMDIFYEMVGEAASGTNPTVAGQEFLAELREIDLDSKFFNITLNNVNGTWTIDQETWDDEMDYFFNL